MLAELLHEGDAFMKYPAVEKILAEHLPQWTKIVKAPDGGGVFTVANGVLLYAPLQRDGTIEVESSGGGYNWVEVTDFYPEDVVLVNKEFGTSFKANL